MFGIPAWIPITAGALFALLAFVVLGACVLAGKRPHPRPPAAHRRPRDNHPQTTREDWLNGTGSFSLDDELAYHGQAEAPQRLLRPFPGDEPGTVIEGPWGAPVRQYGTRLEVIGHLPDPGAGPIEYLPAPELLDDLPPAPAAELDDEPRRCADCGITTRNFCDWCGAPVCGPCAATGHDCTRESSDEDDPEWPARLRAELDEEARGECSDPPEESCSDAGCPAHGWTEDEAAELDEDQAAELYEDLSDDEIRADIEWQAGPDPLDAVWDYWAWRAPTPDAPGRAPALDDPERVLVEEAHAAQLREQDADARAYMERSAAEFERLRAAVWTAACAEAIDAAADAGAV